MADWDEDSPSDSDFIAQYPANERAARAALVANFSVDHQGTDGDDIGKHKKVTLLNQSTDPTATAGQGYLYTKAVSSEAELFWRSSTGNAVQLTAAGGLRAESLVGTVPDGALSGNVPLKNAPNTFTSGQQVFGGGDSRSEATRFQRGATGFGASQLIALWSDTNGNYIQAESDVTASKYFIIRATTNDAGDEQQQGSVEPAVKIRGRANSDLAVFSDDGITLNGNTDISGTLAVGGAATFSNNVSVGGTISGNGSGLTSLNASNLSSGTLPDARLSGNVPLKNAPNTFSSGQQVFGGGNSRSNAARFQRGATGFGASQLIALWSDASGNYMQAESDVTASKYFIIRATTNDAGDEQQQGSVEPAVKIRGRADSDLAVFSDDGITLNGNADISGTLAVGGAATFSNDVTVGGTISGNGSGLTNLNAGNLSSGTVPSDRLPSTIGGNKTFSDNVTVGGTVTGNGSGLTNLNASNLSSGTVPGARLGGNQTMSGNKTFSDNVTINGAARAGTAATSTSSTLAAGQIHHRSSNTTVPSMNAGQWVAVQNTGTSSITLSEGSGVTLELGGTTTTGNRTLLAKGFAFIYFRANGVGVVHGSGVT